MQHQSSGPARPAGKTMDAETLAFAQQIFELVRQGDAATLGPLFAKGLPTNLRNSKGDSLLMLASYHGHFEVAKALLENGADPAVCNDNGQTPIAGAAYKGDLPMVQLLLEHGAHVEGIAPDGKTALMFAAMFNRTEIVPVLLAHGADINARNSKDMTALDLANAMGAAGTAAQLAEAGLTASRITE